MIFITTFSYQYSQTRPHICKLDPMGNSINLEGAKKMWLQIRPGIIIQGGSNQTAKDDKTVWIIDTYARISNYTRTYRRLVQLCQK